MRELDSILEKIRRVETRGYTILPLLGLRRRPGFANAEGERECEFNRFRSVPRSQRVLAGMAEDNDLKSHLKLAAFDWNLCSSSRDKKYTPGLARL